MVIAAHGRYPEEKEEKIKGYGKNISSITVICGSVHWTILIVFRKSLGPIFTSVFCQNNVVNLPIQVFHISKKSAMCFNLQPKTLQCINFFVS